MRLCNDTLTIYNARHDIPSDSTVYIRTVIKGASWYGSTKSTVDSSGLKAANQYTIRIPADADMGGKSYVDPIVYAKADNVDTLFTLTEGDFIVHDEAEEILPRPAALHQAHSEVATILAITDNRRAPKAPHWKVVGA